MNVETFKRKEEHEIVVCSEPWKHFDFFVLELVITCC